MNGLSLRIIRGGMKKSKNLIAFPPVHIETSIFNKTGDTEVFENFANASSTDEQLAILKRILLDDVNRLTDEYYKFLVTVFLLAEAKHPVKCFITRHITKTEILQKPFSEALALQIKSYSVETPPSYIGYMDVLSKLSACLENFPAGAASLKIARVELAGYLVRCLECCITAVNEQTNLSPTEKNELFSLCHLVLRLLLHIIQKGSEDRKLDFIYKDTRLFIQQIVSHEDVPMDTKSLAGILCLTIYITDKGAGSWKDMFANPDPCFANLLGSDAGRLSLYSAVVTVVPADQLTVSGSSQAAELAHKLIEIGDRNSSDSPFTLGVTRALLTISKTVSPGPPGLAVTAALLPFVWGHLDHYMDSVRHLTADILRNVVRFCKKVHDDGDSKPLDNLFTAVSSLDKHRKSYYVSLTLLANCLGAEELSRRLPGLAELLMAALSEQAVQAAATMTLETLMKSNTTESSATTYEQWVRPILRHVADRDVDCTVLSLLESLLANLLASDQGLRDTILPHILSCNADTASSSDLKRVLMLVSAARRARLRGAEGGGGEGLWRGVVGYDVLRRAAVDAVDETRILSLSLIAESPRTTEPLEPGELSLLLYHLEHVSHATPNFRQLLQAPLRKFMKRLEDSYKVLRRQKPIDSHRIECYHKFVEDLRSLCYGNLLRGANYSRRSLSLQVLKWTEYLEMEGFQRTWREEYIDRLLLHLEDSYETNKALALDILQQCPAHMLQKGKYSVSLQLEDILRQASSLKPTECVSAAHKLELLRRRLPGYISDTHCAASEPTSYALAGILLTRLQTELNIAEQSIVRAARDGAMYGVLHCLGHLMNNIDPQAISGCGLWRHLVAELIATCTLVCGAAGPVVNNSSPEGHLPMDGGTVALGDHGNNGGIVLDDGRPVTAQMVLLCAWRSVKEVSLLLGTMSSRLTISSPEDPTRGTLTCDQLTRMGEHFTTLLEQTKHRGAFEQAYVGFTELLARLWRSREPSLHRLPRQWLLQLMDSIAMGGRKDATRRSAGLPFMIQALVTTEVQVQGNPKCFHHCMTTLLRLATPERYPNENHDTETRIHCLNILRALFRNSVLDESVAGYVGQGFVVALNGFEGDTWAERNASTLAFSALMTRVFGAPRSRDKETVRNKMTGRIFFLRYPQLYDFMMEKLEELPSTTELRPVVFPVLVLLSRLYPSSLEGSESALRLAALLPRAGAVAASPGWHARGLAAKAVVPLVSPLVYYSYIESLLTSIQHPTSHNHTHGALLQLTRLLGAKPDLPPPNAQALSEKLLGATWVLTQARGDTPDYVISDEFVKVFNMFVWRLPSLITDDLINFSITALESLLFNNKTSPITFGKEICLSNATYLLLILSTKYKQKDIPTLICNDLLYRYYDVTLSVLNYLLILHNNLSINCIFQEHISELKCENVLEYLRKFPKYIPILCKIFRNSKYSECIQKSLKVLTLEENTHKFVVQIKTGIEDPSDEIIVRKLLELIENEHENLTHIYLECMSTFVTGKLKENNISMELILDVVRAIFAHSAPDHGEDIREVVVKFLERNFVHLIGLEEGWSEQNKFEYTATLWSTVVALLEDDEGSLRNRTCSIVCGLLRLPHTVPARAARELRSIMQTRGEAALLVVLALLDFQSEVCITDEINDECRVFDQNERHNVTLEETVWSYDCAERLRQMYTENTLNHVLSICDNPTYRRTIDKLCNNNVIMFKKLAEGGEIKKSAALNPKIELFIDQLTNK